MTKKSKPKYYSYHESEKLWIISKRINGKKVYLGAYQNEEEAKIAVELFEKYGWNKNNNWKIKAEVKEIIKNKGEMTDGAS